MGKRVHRPSTKKVIKIQNEICPYCGKKLKHTESEEEHVIGKRFVPKGTLHGQWNLILQSCQRCNTKKSDLEDDISAITLTTLAQFYSNELSESLLKEIKRKAKRSFSRKTKKEVEKSEENINVNFPSKSANIEFSASSPPQIDRDRLFELACMQITGFYHFITYDENLNHGFSWKGIFCPVLGTHRKDWGNTTFKSFTKQIVNWKIRWHGITAREFHKSLIRKHPKKDVWAWALEWNKSYRIIGYLGNYKESKDLFQELQLPNKQVIPQKNSSIIRYRKEVELNKEDDTLFKI